MKIKILMSTYNGEDYLETQLNSLERQTLGDISLLVRDDGSSDRTIEMIQDFQNKMEKNRRMQVAFYHGENIGVIASFFNLMGKTDLDADYYAFCDQDDEWLPEKLERAVGILQKLGEKNEDQPLLYCSDKIITDQDLNPIETTVGRPVRKITFGNAVVQDMCTGCTAVVNRQMLVLLRQYTPKFALMHDWWMYLLATCFGKVYYDKEAYIKYRQHGNNTSGAMLNRRQLLRYRVKQLFRPRGEILRQVEEFYCAFGTQMKEENKTCIERLVNRYRTPFGRLLLAFDPAYYRQRKSDTIVLKLLFLFKKL